MHLIFFVRVHNQQSAPVNIKLFPLLNGTKITMKLLLWKFQLFLPTDFSMSSGWGIPEFSVIKCHCIVSPKKIDVIAIVAIEKGNKSSF